MDINQIACRAVEAQEYLSETEHHQRWTELQKDCLVLSNQWETWMKHCLLLNITNSWIERG